ncbi:hypothetical protein Bca52824_095257 [Brassica carinata]|uniref:Knotted 1-binding protein n=1 Tax=Brassica carinata TaxID=52824 RepID=A0A8X7TJY0_BRACI|nr:hypothetical protein Bca52824_095257 [Brassica carinata]
MEAGNGGFRKRMRPSWIRYFYLFCFRLGKILIGRRGKEGETRDGMSLDENETTKFVASDEMELQIAQILDKIESFTQTVSNLLESGKTMFKELSNEFEERLIMIHKEHVEKWQEEIKELRLLDASNEETTSLLHNARFLIRNPNIEA